MKLVPLPNLRVHSRESCSDFFLSLRADTNAANFILFVSFEVKNSSPLESNELQHPGLSRSKCSNLGAQRGAGDPRRSFAR
jgi:hypothetical protein